MLRVHELQERPLGIGGGQHDPGAKLVAVLERHAAGASAVHQHFRHRRAGPDLHAKRCGGSGDGRAHAARAVLGEAPRAEGTVDLAHVVMQQHVGGAGRAGPEEGADDAAGGFRALERIEFEPLVEQVAGRLRRELGDPVALALAQARAVASELQEACEVAPD